MKPFIKKLHISNYKSITNLTVENIGAFAVFAGANGSGKSNFFDALKFVSDFARFGITEALKMHGGWDTIHSVKIRKDNARTFHFEIELDLPFEVNEDSYSTIKYRLNIKNLDEDEPQIEEQGWYDDELQIDRKPNPEYFSNVTNRFQIPFIGGASVVDYGYRNRKKDSEDKPQPFTYQGLWGDSILNRILILNEILRALQIYRIDPLGAKQPNSMDANSKELNENAHNLSIILHWIEQNNKNLRDSIMDIMTDIVPQLQNIHTDKEKYRGSHFLSFKERGSKKEFPAHLISEGTVYALSLLVAVLDKRRLLPSWTLIEEPERGLHPHAIIELMEVFRNQATDKNLGLQPVWLTTHNATLIRCCRPEELFFVEKDKGGNTIIKKPLINPNSTLPLDEAWLSNSLNGGIPW